MEVAAAEGFDYLMDWEQTHSPADYALTAVNLLASEFTKVRFQCSCRFIHFLNHVFWVLQVSLESIRAVFALHWWKYAPTWQALSYALENGNRRGQMLSVNLPLVELAHSQSVFRPLELP